MHHERQKGQSREIFRLKGGTHVRRDKKRQVTARIRFDDTCHITREEADKFGDRFEIVELPVTADDITIPDEENSESSKSEAKKTEEDTVVETEVADAETKAKAEAAADAAEVGVIAPSEPNPPPPQSIDRQDFSSDPAFELWTDAKEPDLSNVARTGHGGRTYSVKDVKSVV